QLGQPRLPLRRVSEGRQPDPHGPGLLYGDPEYHRTPPERLRRKKEGAPRRLLFCRYPSLGYCGAVWTVKWSSVQLTSTILSYSSTTARICARPKPWESGSGFVVLTLPSGAVSTWPSKVFSHRMGMKSPFT